MDKNEKALKIAGFEGFSKIESDIDNFYKHKNSIVNSDLEEENDLIDEYSSYNGLMPIFERVNKTNYFNKFKFKIDFDKVVIRQEYYIGKNIRIKFTELSYKEIPLIEAIMDAIIYYYEATAMK